MKGNKKFLRGEILNYLMTTYPDGIPEQVLFHRFYEYNETEEIKMSTEYLTEKGYTEKKEVPHPYKEKQKVRWFKITAKGIDLLEGNISKDAGIVLD
ncbi:MULTISPECIES: hypothetical protein [Treponema]|uniref:Uncharacterized protein n=1 Tax=Treponema phagedenis TaxID=162 RepID=A0A0B7GZ11_TREPH|nr:hypothetical protein [Treponema phagedenis]NVP22806.1 hypothetical protein [Treponema phagedenis]NVP23789.1 hypothetical protein [Treponema phagedenis]NVP23838.1 hypothetical protein [Treponema phagedenis]NVP24904.1 hypothetical protein [Treponema phagedenis]NVP25336.1 hypothetical protein [Treponema phagedenis]